jgi:hypothetical protein
MAKPGKPADDAYDELQDALRELERQQRPGASPGARRGSGEEQKQDVADAVREIAELQREERRARPAPRLSKAKWPLLGIAIAAFVVAAVIVFRPEPLPPPAKSAPEAVEGFWTAIIAGRYEGATVYVQFLVTRYGSRKQAALELKRLFEDNPPVTLRKVELVGNVPDSPDLLVDYEVIRRSGRPLTGQAVVMDSGDPKTGFTITGGI